MAVVPHKSADVLVFGDDQHRVRFVDAVDGSTVATQQVLYGNVTAAPLVVDGNAWCGTSSSGAGSVCAFDVSSGDPVGEPIQFPASVDAAPAVAGSTLYVAIANGYLYAFDISTPVSPKPLWSFNAMSLAGGTTARVGALALAAGGDLLCLLTSSGLYGVDLTRPAVPAGAWKSAVGVALDQTRPLLDGHLLYATGGSTLYAWDLGQPAQSGTLPSSWTWAAPSGKALGRPWSLAFGLVLVGDAAGGFYAVDTADRTRVTSLNLGATGTSGARATLYGGVLALTGSGGDVWAFSLELTTGGLEPRQLWHQTYTSAAPGPPWAHVLVGGSYFGLAVLVAAADGTVRAYASASGALLWSSSLGASAGAYGPAALGAATHSTAAVRFLLDGHEFFLALRDLLVATAYADLQGGALPNSPSLANLVRWVGRSEGKAANEAFVVLWWTGSVSSMALRILNLALATVAKALKFGGITTLPRSPNEATAYALNSESVQAKLDQYSVADWTQLAAQHEKIAVFSIAGTKIALVSGFNLEQHYQDTVEHPLKGLTGTHDTAVALQGDAVQLVEREFDRRWARVNDGKPPQPKGNTYAKIASWAAEADMSLDDFWVLNGTRPPTPYSNPSIASASVPVSVLRTNREGPLVDEVRQALVAAIGSATSYAYFENLAFYDVPLVRALSQRLQASPAFRVVVMVPLPQVEGADDFFQLRYFAYTKAAWVALLLSLPTWTSFTLENGFVLERSACEDCYVDFRDDAIEQTTLKARRKGISTYASYYVTSIAEVATTEQRVTFCGPARHFVTPPSGETGKLRDWPPNYRRIYIHSKLALFDDAVAVVGSANFTERSMRQDGEMSVAISDPSTVSGIRARLFGHWGTSTIDQWRTDMTAFESSSADAVGVLPQRLASLPSNPWYFSWPLYLASGLVEV